MADAAARNAAMQQAITDLAGFMATFVTAQTGANNGFPATQEGPAQRVEPDNAHRGFPRAQNAVRSRPRPQTPIPRTPTLGLSEFRPCQPVRRVAPLDADAAAGSQ